MSETYVECLVARKPSMLLSILKVVLIVLTVFGVLLGGGGFWPALIVAAAAGVGAYFAAMNANIEYEYLYLDREISVDKVMARSRRKKADNFTVDKMEMFAPLNSHRLDYYRNQNTKTIDYSSGIAAQPEKRYMMIYEGNVKVIFEPNMEMVRAIQSIAPRKVFTD